MKLLGAAILALLILAAPAHAAPTLVKVGDFASPTYITSPPGDAAHLYVTEKAGTVRLLINGAVQPQPFLDISADVMSDSEERGLLSIAFPPDFATTGLFYVYLTRKPDGAIEIRQYRRSAADPNVADPASKVVLVTIPHSDAANHNGGQLQFGPDGKLYAGTGDGGGGNDQFHHSEDLGSMLGKLLRFDATGPVIVAHGLRNPWRFSFAPDGRIVIGDVGQDAYEEVDVGLADDYGWPCFEATHRTSSTVTSCAGGTLPVFERAHSTGACSITGGYVVRDPGLPTLLGRYVYGDFCSADIRSFDLANPAGDAGTGLSVTGLSSFGEDACGRLYTVSLNGPVSEIVDGAPPNCGAPATTTPPPPAACAVAFSVTGLHSVSRRHRLSVAVRANRSCATTVSAKIRGIAQFKAVKLTATTTRRVVSLKLSSHGLSAVRRALRRHHSLRVTVRVGALARGYHVKA
jgi:hypothetical protein